MRYILLLSCLLLSACQSTPQVVQVSGNGQCHPALDLPSHKDMKKVPEQDTKLEDFYGLFLQERKDHASDLRQYNDLYKECVANVPEQP